MAEDTRNGNKAVREDLSREALTVHPEHKAFSGKQWEKPKEKPAPALESANIMPGGTENTAGGKAPQVSITNAMAMIKMDEFKEIHKKPCARDSYMTGIGGGFVIGVIRSLAGGNVWTSCSWAVGSFCFGALGQYQYCMYRRSAEKAGMTRVMEVMNRKELERKAREARKDQAKTERRKAKDEEQSTKMAELHERTAAEREGGGSVRSWKFW